MSKGPIIVSELCLAVLWRERRCGWVEADVQRYPGVYGGSLDGRPLLCNMLQPGQLQAMKQQSFPGQKPENSWGKSPFKN